MYLEKIRLVSNLTTGLYELPSLFSSQKKSKLLMIEIITEGGMFDEKIFSPLKDPGLRICVGRFTGEGPDLTESPVSLYEQRDGRGGRKDVKSRRKEMVFFILFQQNCCQ